MQVFPEVLSIRLRICGEAVHPSYEEHVLFYVKTRSDMQFMNAN